MSGVRPRFHANLEALRVLRRVQAEQRPATPEEQTALARWSGWGAIANQAFKIEHAAQFGDEQAELRSLLDADAYEQAKRTTLSAYYTDAALVQPIWDAVQALGVTSGNVLEPGCGAGTFLGFAPENVHMTGVELDSTTAAIAALLYPDAQVRAESFAHTTAPHGTFDAAVGNVPFGTLALHDPRHNADGHSIHNHFLIKSLDLVKEGGAVAMVTSHWTMDRADQAARAAIEARADVLGVVRLPSGAHQMAAGTNALTDVIVLRKRPSGHAPRHLGPITGGVRDIGEADPACEDAVHVNRYFDVHPEHVLGQTGWRMGQHGPQLEVRADAADLGQMLRERLGQIVERAREAGLSAVPAAAQTAPAQLADPDMVRYEGLLQVTDAGELTRIEEGIARPYIPTNSRAELVDLVRMRDTAKALLDAQQASAEETEHIEQLRTELNQRYDTYRSTYGYLHRRTASGARYPQGGIRRDPWWGYVSALEKFDVDTGKGVKSNLFTRRVVHASAAVERAETPRDALLLSMSGEGEVDLELVARLLGLESASGAQEALGDLVFYDPDRGKHVPEAEYLSGEVRLKLERAREAAVADPSLLRNVQALEQVQPPWLSASEIIPQLGAPWIPDAYVQQFFRELIGNDEVIVKYRGQGIWEVSDHGKSTHKATEIWGTGECPEHKGVVHQSAHELLHQALVQKQPEVTAPDENGRFVQEQEATSQARLRQEAMGREFTDWLWRDAERTAECERLYNHAFNSLRRRDYHRDVDLERVFPGLDTLTFAPRPHQIAATERFLSEGRALFAHPTGAGKTGEIIMAVMEARRLGKATKPLVVVPKNVLEHFATDFARLYPNSQVLASLEGKFTKAHSQEFLAQAAQGDWDAVLVTYEQLKNIPLSHETTKLHIKEQLDQARREFEDVDTEDRSTTKQIEQALAALEERLAKHLLKDANVGWTFDRCGFDGLFLDEVQRIKNITVVSNIKGVSRTGSEIADHALMLHDYMRRAYGDNAVRVGASATPLANSAAEFWVWLRIYYPEYLERLGLTTFDQWAATFAMVYTATETGSVGDVREVERFRKFRNIPEMVQPWSVFADVLTKEDLGLPEPQQVWTDAQGVEHSGPRTVVMPPTLPQLEYIDDLIDRVEKIDAKEPRVMRYKRDETGDLVPVLDHRGWVDLDAKVNAQDRRLMAGPSGAVSHRMADLQAAREEVERFNALSTAEREKYMERYDQVRGAITTGQLVEEEAPGWFQALALGLTKTDWAAQEIYRIWLETKDHRYKDPITEELHPRPGALQLVFGDVGVWSGSKGEDQFTVYDALRDRLVELGMPAEKIRFYQEAKDNERRKKELEEACRDGRVAVIIGSTPTLGTGVNVQDRAVHLLHLDCPWRPMDLEQREGRIIRQGNQNEKVRITRQATPPEAGQWETVARKATMQRQVMRAGTTEREMEDFTPEEHSFSATAAEVATNPRRVALSKAEEQLTSLQRNHALWANSQARARTSLAHAPETTQWYRQGIDHLEQALERRTDTRGKHFTARIGQSRYTVRKEAGAAIKAAVIRTGLIHRAAQEQNEELHTAEIGRLGGFTLAVRVRHRGFGEVSITLVLPDLPAWYGHGDEGTAVVGYESQTHLESTDPVQMCRRLEDAIRGLDKKHAEARVALEDHQKEIRQMEEGLGQPFSHQTELENLFSEVTRLRAELGMSAPTFQVEEATHRQTPLADAPSAPARAPQPSSTPITTSSPGSGTEPPTAAVTPTPTPGTAPSPSRPEAAEAPVETEERSPELFLERARTTIAAAYGDAQAQRRARTQLRSLFIYARDGEVDARQVLELFADYYAIDKRNAPALERLRAQLALPTADSPGFADALIVHVHRDRILVQANAPLPDSLSEALTELGFTTNDHVFWNLDGVTTSAQHRLRLGELLHTLDVLVDAPERMPVEHRDAVLAGPPETAPDPLERSALTGADADLYDQVEDLIERGMLTQAWEKVDVRLQQLRLDQHLTDEEITDTTTGRLHERVLSQSWRRERSLDTERLNMGTLNEAQRQEFEDRYAAGCPHLSAENIRERVQASAEATEALKGASRALASLEHALPSEITARQQVLQTQIRAVAANASPEQAVSLISAANKVDPGGVLAREALRHELVLPNAQAPGFTRALLFSPDIDQPRVHLSRHTPDAARQVLATHGWIFTGSPLDPELSLTGAPEDNHDALHATLADLDALPEPPVRGLLDRWTEAAYPHHSQEAQDAITALNDAATEMGERAQALIGQGQERAAAQLALDHIERAREAGVLHGSATKVANGAYLDAIGAGMTQADELHTHGQTLPNEDVRGRRELARAYWERCPHLGREQIAERTGHTVEQLPFESEPSPASRVNEASAPVAEPAQSPLQQAQTSLELLESTVHSTPEMRTELKKALEALDPTEVGHADINALFVRANRADPDGIWERERLRSALLYPVEGQGQGTPMCALTPYPDEENFESLLPQGQLTPRGLLDKLKALGFYTPRLVRHGGIQALQTRWRYETRRQRINEVIAYCDEHGISVITQEQHQLRRDAQRRAQEQQSDREHQRLVERTPAVRYAVETRVNMGRLREAVALIDAHLTELGLMGRLWQGLDKAKQHELWPLREEVLAQGRERAQPIHQALEVLDPDDVQEELHLLNQLELEAAHLPLNDLQNRIAAAEIKLAQEAAANRADAATQQTSLLRGQIDHTPPDLSVQGTQGRADTEKVRQLATSRRTRDQGQTTGESHAALVDEIHQSVIERLTAQNWAGAWRLLVGARFADFQAVAALNPEDVLHPHHDTLVEMAWALTAEDAPTTGDAHLALAQAEQALAMNGGTGAQPAVAEAVDKLTDCGLWRHADLALHHAQQQGLDVAEARDQMRQDAATEFFEANSGTLLREMGMQVQPQLFDRARLRIRPSRVQERETKDSTHRSLSSAPSRNLTSVLYEMWGDGYEDAVLAVINEANRADPRMAWHREELRSRILFTDTNAYGKTALVRIEHTRAETRVHGAGGLSTDSPLRTALRQATFIERKSGYWSLNHNASHSVRTVRVGQLIHLLDQHGIAHVDESRWQALLHDSDGTRRTDEDLRERLVGARSRAYELWDQGQYREALQVLAAYVRETAADLSPVDRQQKFGVEDLGSDIHTEATALEGQARQRYQKARADGARPSELLQLLEDFERSALEPDQIPDLPRLRRRLHAKMMEGDVPLRSQEHAAPDPSLTEDVIQAETSELEPLVDLEARETGEQTDLEPSSRPEPTSGQTNTTESEPEGLFTMERRHGDHLARAVVYRFGDPKIYVPIDAPREWREAIVRHGWRFDDDHAPWALGGSSSGALGRLREDLAKLPDPPTLIEAGDWNRRIREALGAKTTGEREQELRDVGQHQAHAEISRLIREGDVRAAYGVMAEHVTALRQAGLLPDLWVVDPEHGLADPYAAPGHASRVNAEHLERQVVWKKDTWSEQEVADLAKQLHYQCPHLNAEQVAEILPAPTPAPHVNSHLTQGETEPSPPFDSQVDRSSAPMSDPESQQESPHPLVDELQPWVSHHVAIHNARGVIRGSGKLLGFNDEGVRLLQDRTQAIYSAGDEHIVAYADVDHLSSPTQGRWWSNSDHNTYERRLEAARACLARGDYPTARAHLSHANRAFERLRPDTQKQERQWREPYDHLFWQATSPRDAEGEPLLHIERTGGSVRVYGAGGRRRAAGVTIRQILDAKPRLTRNKYLNAYQIVASRAVPVAARLEQLVQDLQSAQIPFQILTFPSPEPDLPATLEAVRVPVNEPETDQAPEYLSTPDLAQEPTTDVLGGPAAPQPPSSEAVHTPAPESERPETDQTPAESSLVRLSVSTPEPLQFSARTDEDTKQPVSDSDSEQRSHIRSKLLVRQLRRTSSHAYRGLPPAADFMSGKRRALLTQALWALGGELQSRFGGGARYALELGEKRFLGKVTREEEKWAYAYTEAHPTFTQPRTWEELEKAAQAAMRYGDPATAVRLIDSYVYKDKNERAKQMRSEVITECKEKMSAASKAALKMVGRLAYEEAWQELHRAQPQVEALRASLRLEDQRLTLTWGTARAILLESRALSYKQVKTEDHASDRRWRTEIWQVTPTQQVPALVTPGGHVLGLLGNSKQADKFLNLAVSISDEIPEDLQTQTRHALEIYRTTPSREHARQLGGLVLDAAQHGLADFALDLVDQAHEHAPENHYGWWGEERAQIRAAVGHTISNAPSPDTSTDPSPEVVSTEGLSAETSPSTVGKTSSAEPAPKPPTAGTEFESASRLAPAPAPDTKEEGTVPVVEGPLPGGRTEAGRVAPGVEPEFTSEPGTDPAERAATAIEGIGRNRPLTPQSRTFWDDLDQALTDLSTQGRHQEVVDTVSRVREQNHHHWWRWETHRSRATAALNPNIVDQALLLHHARTDNGKAETHLYGVAKSDKDLHRLLKRSPLNLNHKVTENRWQVDPRWGRDKHELRLRDLIRHFEDQGLPYLAQHVHTELIEQRSSNQSVPKTAPAEAETDLSTPDLAQEPTTDVLDGPTAPQLPSSDDPSPEQAQDELSQDLTAEQQSLLRGAQERGFLMMGTVGAEELAPAPTKPTPTQEPEPTDTTPAPVATPTEAESEGLSTVEHQAPTVPDTSEAARLDRATQTLEKLRTEPSSAERERFIAAVQTLFDHDQHSDVQDLIHSADLIDPQGWWERADLLSRARFTANPGGLAYAARIDYDGAKTIIVHLTGDDKEQPVRELLKDKSGPYKARYDGKAQHWKIKKTRLPASEHREILANLLDDLSRMARTWVTENVHTELTEQHRVQAETALAAAGTVAPINDAGHVGALADVLTYPSLRVSAVIRHKDDNGEPRDSWTVVYDTGQGAKLTEYVTTQPTVQRGQLLTDVQVKIHDHTFSARGDARTVIIRIPPRQERSFPLTPEQEQIRASALNGQKIVVQAGAGTGKTATMGVVAESMAEQDLRGIYVVYGRANADEASVKLAHVPVAANTIHAFARRAVGGPYHDRITGDRQPNWKETAKALGLQSMELSSGQPLDGEDLARLVDRTVRTFELSADLTLTTDHIPHLPGLSSRDQRQVQRTLEPVLDQAWADMCDPAGHLFRYRHDTYVKIWQLTPGGPQMHIGGQGRPYLLVDEAQDMNPVAEAILQAQTHMQQIWVGDSSQAIHGWRGAKDALINQNPDVELTLTQSFRFGKDVATEANKWLGAIDAPLRVKGTPSLDTVVHDRTVEAPDAVLARTNAGAFNAALSQLHSGRRVAIVGGTDDLTRLIDAADKLQSDKRTTHPDLSHFRTWSQVVKCAFERPEDLGSLVPFVHLVEKLGTSAVRDALSQMTDTDPEVEVCTAHKSKGLEWDRVQIADDFSPKENQEWTAEEFKAEAQLAYVATTRARRELGRGSLAYIDDYVGTASAHTAAQEASQKEEHADPTSTQAPAMAQEAQMSETPEPTSPADEPAVQERTLFDEQDQHRSQTPANESSPVSRPPTPGPGDETEDETVLPEPEEAPQREPTEEASSRSHPEQSIKTESDPTLEGSGATEPTAEEEEADWPVPEPDQTDSPDPYGNTGTSEQDDYYAELADEEDVAAGEPEPAASSQTAATTSPSDERAARSAVGPPSVEEPPSQQANPGTDQDEEDTASNRARASRGTGPLRSDRRHLHIDMPGDEEEEQRRALHVEVPASEHPTTETPPSAEEENTQQRATSQGQEQEQGQEQPTLTPPQGPKGTLIDGRKIRAADKRWQRLLEGKGGRSAARKKVDPKVYEQMRKQLKKALDNDTDVHLVMPTNDLEQLRQFISMAREYGYEITLSARIPPEPVRVLETVEQLNSHLHKGHPERAISATESRQEYANLREILSTVHQEHLVDRVECYPREGVTTDPTSVIRNHLIGDQDNPRWSLGGTVEEHIRFLERSEVNADEDHRLRTRVPEIAQGLLPDEVIQQNQPHLKWAHDQIKDGVNYLARTNAERQPFKDAARRTTITTNEEAVADHKDSPAAPSPEPFPNEHTQPAPEHHKREPAMAGAPPTREEALSNARMPHQGHPRRPPSSPRPPHPGAPGHQTSAGAQPQRGPRLG